MTESQSPFLRALATVESFSDKALAVLPDNPSAEMLQYVAKVTGEDLDKLARIYDLFLATGRLDSFDPAVFSGKIGFAED